MVYVQKKFFYREWTPSIVRIGEQRTLVCNPPHRQGFILPPIGVVVVNPSEGGFFHFPPIVGVATAKRGGVQK